MIQANQIDFESNGVEGLTSFMSERDFKSFDPYDGLSSPFASLLAGNFLQRAWIQFVKRGPHWLRIVTRIPKHRMVVVESQVLSALSISGSEVLGLDVQKLARSIIISQNSDGGWGYEFDATLRWGSYSAKESNLIATYFCVNALDQAGVTGSWRENARAYLENQYQNGYFRYENTNQTLIHNANILGALALQKCGGNEELVKRAVNTSISKQNSDGSWWYGEGSSLQWVDHFHTCYVLQALLDLKNKSPDVPAAIELGTDFWRKELFLNERPKYFASDQKSTEDLNTLACATQLAATIEKMFGGDRELPRRASALKSQLIAQLRSDSKLDFAFRWKAGPAAVALAQFETIRNSQNG